MFCRDINTENKELDNSFYIIIIIATPRNCGKPWKCQKEKEVKEMIFSFSSRDDTVAKAILKMLSQEGPLKKEEVFCLIPRYVPDIIAVDRFIAETVLLSLKRQHLIQTRDGRLLLSPARGKQRIAQKGGGYAAASVA